MKSRKTDFQGGKSALIVDMMKCPEMESIMESKDISVNPAERLLLTIHSLQSIIIRKMLSNGYNMQSYMINGYSIRKCAENVKISIPTSFYWRQKY